MSDVRKVFVTREIADKLNTSSSYLLRIAKSLNLNESEMRETGKRNYLFSEEAVVKIKQYFGK